MELIDTALVDHVMTITLNDEPRRNALSAQMLSELMEAIDVAERDDDVRVVVLTNRGTTFCSGANLAEQSSTRPPAGGATVEFYELLRRIRTSPKVFVGRLNGHCVAGGVGLAAVTDVSVAIETATFGFSEVRLGVVPAVIAVVCLPKMRRGDAQSAFLRGNRFSAGEAVRLGLITTSVAPDDLDREVDAVVNDILAGEPHALGAVKLLTSSLPSMSEEEAIAWTAELSSTFFRSEAAQAGMRAFLEKRPAPWVTRSEANGAT
jgi:methylglutaconyl-CoA hydratase